MPETAKILILHKMTSSKAAGAGLPVARQLRRALERAAETSLGLTLEVRAVHQSLRPLEEVRGLFEKSGFLALLEGRPAAGVGLDLAVLGGIVEHQAVGRIFPDGDPSREPTRVDAALLAPLLEACLKRFSDALNEDGETVWGQGYGFGAMVGSARGLVLALGDGLYHVFELDLALMGGVREGRMIFAFPDKVNAALAGEAEDRPAHAPEESLRAGVLSAQATLDAVLARVPMPLAQLQGLTVGERITLPPGALQEARLEIGAEAGGLPVALGQLDGFRAVRLLGGQDARSKAGAGKESASMRMALEETSEVAELPLDAVEVEVAQEALGEDREASESASQPFDDGLDDLDDLLGEDGGETAAMPA